MAESPSRLCLLLALMCCSFQLARCNNTQINYRDKKEKQVLDKILGPGRYDAMMKPPGQGGTDNPTTVRVNFLLQSISKIDDHEMKYSIQLIFRQEWRDERLKYFEFEDHLKYLTLTEASAVWKPDLFFTNEIGGDFHNITKPNLFIRTFPYGTVLYSSRISLTLTCPMNLKMYPLDRQVCSLKIASYGWTTDDLILIWKENALVEVAKDLHVPGFTLEKTVKDFYNTLTNAGEYSCLKVDFFFKRLFSYYLIHIYIPYFMLVIVSWISFWLDQEAVLARVLLGVTTLLTMAVQTSNINASVPSVSYIKAIDVWTGVCLTFIFGALLEFFLVNYASRSDMRREIMKKKRRSMDATPNQKDTDSNTIFTMKPLTRQLGEPPTMENVPREMQLPRPNCCKIWLSKFPTGSKRIDVISRFTFPLMFALFNLVYWSTYL